MYTKTQDTHSRTLEAAAVVASLHSAATAETQGEEVARAAEDSAEEVRRRRRRLEWEELLRAARVERTLARAAHVSAAA